MKFSLLTAIPSLLLLMNCISGVVSSYLTPCSTTNSADIVLAVADSKFTAYRSYYGYTLSPGLVNFIKNFISQCDYSKNRLAIVAFSNTVRYISPFSNNVHDLNRALYQWRPEFGAANTNVALSSIRSYLAANARPAASRIVVVVTPQQSTNYQATVAEGQMLRNENVGIIGVAYSRFRPTHELVGITGNAHHVFLTHAHNYLGYAVRPVKQLICKLSPILAPTTPAVEATTLP